MNYSLSDKNHGQGRCQCACGCDERLSKAPRKVVLTGGPGAGKTAVLNLAQQQYCQHLRVLQESASILFGGGFPRLQGEEESKAAQRAIYRVQLELEVIGAARGDSHLLLCDRGTVDGLAYWPGEPDGFLLESRTTLEKEYARYDAVLHLRTPPAGLYEGDNGVRTESSAQALRIDDRIAEVWSGHPNVTTITSADDFLHKAERALTLITALMPASCQPHHPQPALGS